MKAIKTLVAVMGILLLGGLGLLGYGLTTKTGRNAKPTALADFGAVAIPLPAGARVEQMAVAGERVILRIAGPGPERLIVLDPAGGTVTGSFVMTPEAPAVAR
ncbi:MAG: hypothetical protein HQL42_19325 [Alphaproteobacteria bacterium]|nr:hypothetical protein [Alphaproteobacteria bacterium]